MGENDGKNGGENSSLGDEKELFKRLFREELDIPKKAGQGQVPSETDGGATEAAKEDLESPIQGDDTAEIDGLSTAERKIIKIKPVPGAENDTVKSFEAEEDLELQELIDTSPIWRYRGDDVEEVGPERDAKPVEKSHPLRTALLALLLLAIGAFAIIHSGIIDLTKFMPLSEWRPVPVVKHRVVRKSPTPPISEERPPNQPSTPETPVEKPVAVTETPKPVSSTAQEIPLKKPAGVEETPEPTPSTEEPIAQKTPPETASREEPVRTIQPPGWVEAPYPYSVYLGSFRTPERLQKAMTDYGSRGLSPYWVQVDLGEKGKWFRLYTGFFRTRREADAFIRENQVPGAASRHTKYALLIGTYTSEEDLHMEKMELRSMGYSCYEVKGANGVYRLYTGAFYQMARAQKHKADLASKGIRGEVVER